MDEEDYIEIDDNTIINVRFGIIRYSIIFIVFVFLPLLITTLTSNSLSKLNIFAGFVGLTIVCFYQIINLSKFLLSVQVNYEEEENESDE